MSAMKTSFGFLESLQRHPILRQHPDLFAYLGDKVATVTLEEMPEDTK